MSNSERRDAVDRQLAAAARHLQLAASDLHMLDADELAAAVKHRAQRQVLKPEDPPLQWRNG